MLFTPQLRRTLESSFLPLACECTVTPGGSLMIRIFDPQTQRVAMLVNDVTVASLTTMRAVSELVAELRYDLGTVSTAFGPLQASAP